MRKVELGGRASWSIPGLMETLGKTNATPLEVISLPHRHIDVNKLSINCQQISTNIKFHFIAEIKAASVTSDIISFTALLSAARTSWDKAPCCLPSTKTTISDELR